jgi:hypothetical protein
VVIANRGKPVVRLVKAEAPRKRQWGAWEGLMTEAEIDHAFSPEVEAEIAREWIASLERPLEAAGWWQARSALADTRLGESEMSAFKQAHDALKAKLLPQLTALGFLG